DTLSSHNLGEGFLVGMVVLNFAVRRLEHPCYMHRVLACLKLTLIFCAEVVRSGLRVAYLILHPTLPMCSSLLAVPLDVTCDEAITMLAGMITMAPGSISIELSNDRKVLYVHALEAGDPHKAAAFFKNAFERHILEVFM